MRRKIPKGHTLDVALAIVRDQKDVTPALVSELEKIAAEHNGRDRLAHLQFFGNPYRFNLTGKCSNSADFGSKAREGNLSASFPGLADAVEKRFWGLSEQY